MSHVMNTYGRLPVAFTHGQGVWVWDSSGRRYLDALAGVAVNGLGHAHPRLLAAITEQASRLIHVSNLYQIPQQEDLARRLHQISGLDRTFFCNSGCEANEAAIKLARLFGHKRGVESPVIIVMEKAFHGRTLATLSATGSRKYQAGFEPLVAGFVRVPYNDLAAVEQVAQSNRSVVAILIEAIQGEGGVNLVQAGYLEALRRLCDRHTWLLMMDEVQCGMGRSGKWFAYQHSDVRVDVMTLAKGLGSGLPIGACVAGGDAALTFKPGTHGSTFGGNALACAAAIATLDIIEQDGLLAHAEQLGARISAGIRDGLADLPGVRSIRGRGLMIGVELNRDCNVLIDRALEQGLLINVTADNVVRLLPPLIMSNDEADQLLAILIPLMRALLQS